MVKNQPQENLQSSKLCPQTTQTCILQASAWSRSPFTFSHLYILVFCVGFSLFQKSFSKNIQNYCSLSPSIVTIFNDMSTSEIYQLELGHVSRWERRRNRHLVQARRRRDQQSHGLQEYELLADRDVISARVAETPKELVSLLC